MVARLEKEVVVYGKNQVNPPIVTWQFGLKRTRAMRHLWIYKSRRKVSLFLVCPYFSKVRMALRNTCEPNKWQILDYSLKEFPQYSHDKVIKVLVCPDDRTERII